MVSHVVVLLLLLLLLGGGGQSTDRLLPARCAVPRHARHAVRRGAEEGPVFDLVLWM
jgi:hypothetical protein